MQKQKLSRYFLQSSFIVSSIFLHFVFPANAADIDSLESIPLPEVLTPVRLKQPRTEVPASVSVIDAATIAASGIRELPEIFRLIPGMAVGARSGWDYIVSYHGMNRYNSHRMQVMIDGRSIYQAGLANIDWSDIPLAMEDIERIEVTRGPNTASYGANSFLGIINIITRHPDDNPSLRLKTTQGNNSTNDFYASVSDSLGASSYRLTLASKRDSGFDEKEFGQPRRDGKHTKFINGRWVLTPAEDWQLDLQAGYKTGFKQDDQNVSDRSPHDLDVDNYFVSARSQHFLSATNSLKWQLDAMQSSVKKEWITCAPLAVSSYYIRLVQNKRTILCGDVNENSRSERVDIDIQDTWLSKGPWKLVTGAHVQYQNVESETYYSGAEQRDTYQLFANLEYRFFEKWRATIGGSQEYFEHGEEEFSPRVALLFLPNENHSVRIVYSEAVRTPDLFERHLQWHYIAENAFTVPHQPVVPNRVVTDTVYSPASIKPERIRSRELGYYSLWWNRRLEWDIKLFSDDMDDLISDNISYPTYHPVNSGDAEQRGGETEVNLHVSDIFSLHVSGAVIDSSTNTFREENITPHTSGSIGAIYQLTPEWQLSSFYYYQNRINDQLFRRWDNRIAKSWKIDKSRLTLSAVVQHYYQNHDFTEDNVYDGLNRIYFSADISF